MQPSPIKQKGAKQKELLHKGKHGEDIALGVCFMVQPSPPPSNRRVQSKQNFYTTDGTVRTQLIGLVSWVNFVKPLRVSNCAN